MAHYRRKRLNSERKLGRTALHISLCPGRLDDRISTTNLRIRVCTPRMSMCIRLATGGSDKCLKRMLEGEGKVWGRGGFAAFG